MGKNSVLLLDGPEHMRQRKLMLPSFHGRADAALRRPDARDRRARDRDAGPSAGHSRCVRALRRSRSRSSCERCSGSRTPGGWSACATASAGCSTSACTRPALARIVVPPLRRTIGRRIWKRFLRLRADVDERPLRRDRTPPSGAGHGGARRRPLGAAPGARRGRQADDGRGAARRADDAAGGGPRDDRHVACLGLRAPAPPPATSSSASRPRSTVAASDDYLDAVIKETLRHAPRRSGRGAQADARRSSSAATSCPRVRASRRTSTSPIAAPTSIPSRSGSGPSASSTTRADTYSWIPFGGGIRRCLGASFATLRDEGRDPGDPAGASRCAPSATGPEPIRRRAITFVPARDATRGRRASSASARPAQPAASGAPLDRLAGLVAFRRSWHAARTSRRQGRRSR